MTKIKECCIKAKKEVFDELDKLEIYSPLPSPLHHELKYLKLKKKHLK